MSRRRARHSMRSLLRARAEAEALARGERLPPEPKRGKPRHIEDDEQAKVFEWVDGKEGVTGAVVAYPLLRLLHAIPNGGKRKTFEAFRLVKQGVRKGVLDLDLPVPRAASFRGGPCPEKPKLDDVFIRGYIGLRIEMKAPIVPGEKKPVLSPEQKWWATELQQQGHCVCICYGAAQAIEALTTYLTGEPVPHQWSPK